MWFKSNKSQSADRATHQKTHQKTRQTTRQKGDVIEVAAQNFLRTKGLRPVTRNYLIKGGEIDLVMRDGEVLVFIEVRFRQSTDHGSGAETVTYQKQRRLRRAALHYLQKHYGNHEPDCRFDVISAHGTPVVFDWIPNAF